VVSSRVNRRSRLPGFGLALGTTILWLSLIILIPISAVFVKSLSQGWGTFWAAAGSPRALAAYRLSFGAAAIAGAINCIFGLLVAWVGDLVTDVSESLLESLLAGAIELRSGNAKTCLCRSASQRRTSPTARFAWNPCS